MKNWFSRNLTNIISLAFVIPILLVAFVSISHVTSFYGLSNPITWAMYLSVGIEIAALSALAAVSVNMGRFVYFPFIIVTFIKCWGMFFFHLHILMKLHRHSKIGFQWLEGCLRTWGLK